MVTVVLSLSCFGKTALKIFIIFRLTTKKGGEEQGLKYNNFLPPKLTLKILPGLAS